MSLKGDANSGNFYLKPGSGNPEQSTAVFWAHTSKSHTGDCTYYTMRLEAGSGAAAGGKAISGTGAALTSYLPPDIFDTDQAAAQLRGSDVMFTVFASPASDASGNISGNASVVVIISDLQYGDFSAYPLNSDTPFNPLSP